MIKPNLRITILQIPLVWESPLENTKTIDDRFKTFSDNTDILLLPEMFSSGFTMSPERVAEKMSGETVKWMIRFANKHNTAIGGSIVIKEKKTFYNRFIFVTPEGDIHTYNKKHTFTLAGEHKVYKEGIENGIIDYKGWKICLRICYDLRFPVWNRNIQDYDLLIFVANWPKPRIQAWDTLLRARAIENMAYVAGVNIIGNDPNGSEYPGHSAVYDVLGKELAHFGNQEKIGTIDLDHQELQLRRKQLRFLEDQDSFEMY